MALVHVVGAGVSGLACALRLAEAGCSVAVYEAAGHAGGRCRSFFDSSLGCLIDNGSHLLLSGNRAVLELIARLGTMEKLHEVRPACFPFLDLATGRRWALRPGAGPLPLWLLSARRRPRGARLGHWLATLRLARAGPEATVAECVGRANPLLETLWQPLVRAALNADATEASARLAWAVVRETLAKGEAASRPLIFAHGLSPTLIDPLVRTLRARGVDIRYKARLRSIGWTDDRVSSLVFPEGALRVALGDAVVLAVPPEACAEIWPAIETPSESRSIVNVHFRLPEPAALPGGQAFLGLIGAEAQWLFARGDVLSVTVSAADRLLDEPPWRLANRLWTEAAHVLGRNVGRMPPWRVIKERRATFAQTPAQDRRRPGQETSFTNLVLAGDWTATGLPATIEGGVRSGLAAAERVLARPEPAR